MNQRRASAGSSTGFLVGDGEMSRRTRDFDWSRTPVGPIDGWPQGLKTAVRIMLGSRYAMWLGWGPEFTLFYNDAYAKMTLGPKHPGALGRPTGEVWPEIWNEIGPRAESVLRSGEATWDEGLLLFLERRGFPEESYHTFSYSPLPGDGDGVGGMLCVVTEDTERVIGERRLRTLRELAAHTIDQANSVEEACRKASEILADNGEDLPFSLIYLLDTDGRHAQLAGTSGVTANMPISSASVPLDQNDDSWPLRDVVEKGDAIVVDDLSHRFGEVKVGPWPEVPQQAMILPLAAPGHTQLAGFLVAGVSSRLPFDDSYRGFFDLLAGQISATVANARAYEVERERANTLAELDRAKTAFFSNVSHEFRTPLTLMLGPIEDMLSRSYTELSPSAKGQLEVVNRNGLRLLRLVNSLLDFSRIEAGRVRAAFQPTDLTAYTSDLASVFRAACERAGLRLTVECSPLTEPVFVDRDMWEKIVLNLLSNAFKFTYEGGIRVTLREVEGTAELCVRDTGTGVPTEEMPRLFERFHRIENARGRTHEGSGIGLALVQELVKLHGGSITADSVMGAGTTFTVTVPLGSGHLPSDQIGESRGLASTGTGATPYVEEALRWLPDAVHEEDQSELPSFQEPLSIPAVSSGRDPSDQRPHVLVADDNADMRQYVVRLLSEQYSVTAVTNGETALEAALQEPPDLILSDVMMPRLDGFGLLRELRAESRTRAIPFIMLSARAGEESRVEGMEAGADDYLVKPFSARELLARVGAHLQMARLRRESEQAVRQSEERLRMALTAARMVAWQLDPSSGKLAVSTSAAEVFGLPSGTILEHSDEGFALLHPHDVERHRAKVQEAMEVCGSYVSQFRIIRPDDGEIVWMEDRGHGVPNDSGETEQLIGVMIDITERKRTDEELQKERDLLSVTLASIGDAVVTTDTEGRVTNLNGVAERLTRWRNAEAVGKPLDEVFRIVNEETRQSVENPAMRALKEGIIVGLANHTVLIARDGTECPIDDSAAPIFSRDGNIIGCVLIFRDVTERRRQESLLSNQNRVLEQVIRSGPLGDILDTVCLAVERNIDSDAIATVLLTDANGAFLRPAAGPRCPEEYSAALGSVPIGPNCGSCGTAAHLGEPVLVDDIATDPLWADYRHLALQYDLRACWSVPIFSSTRTILGTFAVYLPSPRRPSDQDLQMTEFLARTVGIAIQRHNAEEAVRDSELRYRLVGQAANDAIWDWNLVTNQVTWNEGLQSRFGYTENQIGTDASWWIENIHPDDRERVTHSIHAVIDSDEELWNDEYRYRAQMVHTRRSMIGAG